MARKRARVAQLEPLPQVPPPGTVPPGRMDPLSASGSGPSAADAEIARLQALSGAKSDLIEALTKAGEEKDALIASVTAARDAYRTALLHETERARLLEIAHDAQLAAVRAERWQGRAEGAVLTLLLHGLL